MKIIITKGIPASGKSTWAKAKIKSGQGKWKRITKDYLRYMLDETQFSKAREKFVQKARDVLLEAILSDGFNAIVDDTNLHPKHEERIREIAKKYNAEVEVRWFPVTLKDALKRNERREARVPPEVIHTMYRQYVEAGGPTQCFEDIDCTPVYNSNLPNAVVCDLDGTLCNFSHHRSPYDASTCDQDEVNEPVLAVIRAMSSTHRIILMSGREDLYKPQTRKFLVNNNVPYHFLFMRKYRDSRKDSIVKRELYEKHINGIMNVTFWLDDRDQVVEMVRALGIPCFQVNYGRF